MSKPSDHISQQTDEDLIAVYRRNGDKAVIGELFKRYGHLVFGVCLKYLKNKEEANDMVLQTFEKLMEDLKSREVQNFRSWLHTVTKNNCLMHLRKHKKVRERETDFELVDPYLKAEEESNEKAELEVKLTNLEAAVTELKDEQKQCIELFYLQEKCYNEVAEITGFTLKQVKSFIQNGKRNLRNILIKKNELSIR